MQEQNQPTRFAVFISIDTCFGEGIATLNSINLFIYLESFLVLAVLRKFYKRIKKTITRRRIIANLIRTTF